MCVCKHVCSPITCPLRCCSKHIVPAYITKHEHSNTVMHVQTQSHTITHIHTCTHAYTHARACTTACMYTHDLPAFPYRRAVKPRALEQVCPQWWKHCGYKTMWTRQLRRRAAVRVCVHVFYTCSWKLGDGLECKHGVWAVKLGLLGVGVGVGVDMGMDDC